MPEERSECPFMLSPERGMLAVGMPSWRGLVGCKESQRWIELHEGWWCHTSLLPRPKPLITGPRSFSGKGACGVSGPAMGSRAPVGRTIVLYRKMGESEEM